MRLSFTQSIIEVVQYRQLLTIFVLHNLSFVSSNNWGDGWRVNHRVLETIPYICTSVHKLYFCIV